MSTATNIHLSTPTIRRDVELTTRFLMAVSRSPELKALLEREVGYGREHHELGCALLRSLTDYSPSRVAPVGALLPQERALAELEAWDGPAFERTRAALRISYPRQFAYIFDDLAAEAGPGAFTSAHRFIRRVVALRDGTDPERESSREQDRQAVAALAERRIFDAEIEARLRGLLAQATELPASPAPKASEELEEAARKLHAWINDWRGQARAVIKRRDYLVRLGFARRKRGEEATLDEDAEPLSQAS